MLCTKNKITLGIILAFLMSCVVNLFEFWGNELNDEGKCDIHRDMTYFMVNILYILKLKYDFWILFWGKPVPGLFQFYMF